jgi:mannose-6-phosphate isomerase-like protein (cupin superfamily)
MITVIDTTSRSRIPKSEGTVRDILAPANDGTRVHVAIREVDPGKACHIPPSDKTQVVYVLEGNAGEITFDQAHTSAVHPAQRGHGVYLEPGEKATIKASGARLVLLHVEVPKHTGKPTGRAGDESAAGYFFDESRLRALVDEKGMRTRTFWVNKETGLSESWDLQLGRMLYGPNAQSPRHVHNAAKSSAITPEHFYFIETGTGQVVHDGGSLPVGPGSLVLIPAGEWHQLVASETGFNYIEFQAPFDFATTMDHDPLGKNWYIQGTDDGTGRPKLWVQS